MVIFVVRSESGVAIDFEIAAVFNYIIMFLFGVIIPTVIIGIIYELKTTFGSSKPSVNSTTSAAREHSKVHPIWKRGPGTMLSREKRFDFRT